MGVRKTYEQILKIDPMRKYKTITFEKLLFEILPTPNVDPT
jgi:hypothetical protein